MNFSRQIYASLLRGLYAAKRLLLSDSRKRYLATLSDLIPPLRNTYRIEDRVSADTNYTDENTQAAYLLAFLPDYAKRIRYILANDALAEDLDHLSDRRTINVCSFGAGPCPELPALSAHARENEFEWSSIRATAFDIDPSWVFSRVLVQNHVCPSQNPDVEVSISHETLDLCTDNFTQNVRETCERADLVVIQNVLNELKDVGHFASLLRKMCQALPSGAHVLISDVAMLSNYKIAERLIECFPRGDLRKFEGKAIPIERCVNVLKGSSLESLIKDCPSLLARADEPYKFNCMYFSKD